MLDQIFHRSSIHSPVTFIEREQATLSRAEQFFSSMLVQIFL